ncbi:MAG: GatB/YqeY domain-containing protein [Burkholderiales bacterium]|nr:GatB/YqeY domain-containing protein [Burkholderiales bacterium]
MNLKSQVEQDIRRAMKARSETELSTLRLLMAALKQQEIDHRIELTDAAVLTIIEKMIKQRKESLRIFREAQRDELANKEQAELDILMSYMPQQINPAEAKAAVQAAILEVDAQGPKDMGKVMGILKSQLAGKADFSALYAIVKEMLN